MIQLTKISFVAASLLLAAGFTASTASAEDAMPKQCVVNGDEFAEHKNPPIKVTHKNESIKVCCKKCARKFKKDPEKYIKEYKKAVQENASSAAAQPQPKTASAAQTKSCCSSH